MLREVTEKDYLTWWRIYMDDSVNPFLYYEQMDEKQFKSIFDDFCKKGKMFVYEKNHNIVGICQLILLPKPYQDTLIIGTVAIDPTHHRKGHATSLLKDILNWIKKTHSEIVRVELYAETDNPNARKCYEKVGFKTEAILEDWFKRDSGTHQHKWYVSEHIMTLMLKDIPNNAVMNKAEINVSSNLKNNNLLFHQASISDDEAITEFVKKYADFLEINVQHHLKRGDVYILKQDKKIMAYCHIKQGAERLKHNAFMEMFIINPDCSDNAIHYFLEQIIHAQRQKKIKRLEISILENNQKLINNVLNIGFEHKGILKARFKHPITNQYFDQHILEYSLFTLDDAIQCIQASESKTLNKNTLIDDVKKMQAQNLDPSVEHLIYKFVRDVIQKDL